MRWIATWPSSTCVEWRGLTWAEYRRIQDSGGSDYSKWLEVYRLCVTAVQARRNVGPEPDKVGYGIIRWIGRHQLENNPFSGQLNTIQKSLQTGRARVQNSYLQQARAIVAAVFRCSFEEIDSWDAETFFDRVAQAEAVLSRPIEPVDPNVKSVKPGRPPRVRR